MDESAATQPERTPGMKLLLAMAIAAVLAIPLFTVWLLAYDREMQSQTALASIAEGWGGPQIMSGPTLVIPYRVETSETIEQDGEATTRTREIWRELRLAPQNLTLETQLATEPRSRSIYEAVVYTATNQGRAVYALPDDLDRLGIDPARMAPDRAELRFGLLDMRGIQETDIRFAGRPVAVRSGGGDRPGFSAFVDATGLMTGAVETRFAIAFRGNQRVAIDPLAGETRWTVRSSWPHPSFTGSFIPASHEIGAAGFEAEYRITNLALSRSLIEIGEGGASSGAPAYDAARAMDMQADANEAQISLVEPVDLYSQVNRSVKYGFLFIGFTFLVYLMFDVIAGVRVSAVEYLLVGAGLVLFFVMLLAFAEVIGFGWAYLVAASAIIGLVTGYSAAVLKSWRRAAYVAGMLASLYAVMYVLLSRETLSLLIGSLLLFAALAAVMYATRNLDWGRGSGAERPG